MSIYGLIISFAILVCVLLAEKRVLKDSQDTKIFWNLSLITIVCGIIGARLYHAVDLWSYYSTDPVKILYLWHGGLGIWGAIAGGFLGATIYLKQNKLYWLDLAASVVPLGQAIGRWGNYFNHENFGLPTTLPWGILINGEKYHPLFLYESILNLILFLITVKLKRGSGIPLITYLIGYSTIRFFLEFLKYDPWKIYGINVAQLFSIAVVAAVLLLKNKRPLNKETL